MKKNINKLIAIGIGLSVIVGNVSPVLATETIRDSKINTISGASENSLKILTLDKAIEAGLNNDDQMKILSSNLNYYKDLQDYYDEADNDNGEDQNDVNIDSAKQSKEFRKDAVEYEITNLYNSIVLAEKQVEYQREIVNNEETKTSNMKLKYNKGLIDSVSMSKQEASLKTEKDTLQAKINSLNDLKEKLKLATGINVNNYTFDDRLNYEKLKLDGDLESYIDDKISIITKYDRELADLLEDAVDDMKDDDLDDLEIPDKDKFYNIPKTDSDGNVIGYDLNEEAYNTAKNGALAAYKGYLEAKKGSESASAGVNIKEKTYKNMLRSNYSNILAMEDGIDQLITNIDIANKSLANTKLQYQLGLMTTNDYNTAATGYRQLDISLRQTLNQYYQLKIVFEKPWAVSSSSSAGQ
ncbi:TolC family protein [Clostridium sp.]|uniref:TolC family protein n=1 Tax=Clostridium sp. TaxID=1506 RepID=UPI002914BA50|nr:TolC family protein [Clostridium sp.]MDU4846811.1 TolC family protein [Clostridium sp.]